VNTKVIQCKDVTILHDVKALTKMQTFLRGSLGKWKHNTVKTENIYCKVQIFGDTLRKHPEINSMSNFTNYKIQIIAMFEP
jgi:hypothetical protein